jgi:lysophospholipase L1-like esterase
VGSLVCSEILLRFLIPPTKEFFVLIPHTRKVFEPAPDVMPGVGGVNHYVVNSRGIRGREFGPDDREYRILAIGGSTTECLYLDEAKAWTHVLQEDLSATRDGRRVWVGNVGRSGLRARDHVVQVKYLTPQYPRLDAILILVGVNDLTVALKQGDRFTASPPVTDREAEKRQIRRAFLIAPGKINDPQTDNWMRANAPWYKATAVWQVLSRAKVALVNLVFENILAQDARGQVYARWRANRRSASSIIDALPDLRLALEEYRRDINAIVDVAQSLSVRIVFLTQPSLWRSDLTKEEEDLLWLGGIGEFQTEPNHPYYSSRVLAEAMARYNDILKQVCRSRNAECVDLAAEIKAARENFFDDAHFTEAGSRRVGAAVAKYFRDRPPHFQAEPAARK